ncbi:hypothetical protein OVS_02040 [Mycoplasma ovis str. Michigan]|uniref:Uncharacterized protein n=1 Tax=Mycoplasma ovis str. Michigan TaxID=1415773 RepID=A0ABN4BLI4_9MOLU|nr:hypothetical protein [Mycoplasma ovis]AHC40271.1 hypothetical protein OVS_02040 [Mycoplasma ovis str. Michigan]
MLSFNLLSKSSLALCALVGGAGVAYGLTNSSTKNYINHLSKQSFIEKPKSENVLTPLTLKANEVSFSNQEESPEKHTLSRGEKNPTQLRVNSLDNKQDSDQKLKNEDQRTLSKDPNSKTREQKERENNFDITQNPPIIVEKNPDIESSYPPIDELSKNNSLSKNYFIKGEEDFLEEEEWTANECEWLGSGLEVKLKCQWTNGEIYSKSREVIFHFSEKDIIIIHQLNNSDIRDQNTKIYFDPSLDGGELTLIFKSYETIKVRLEHKIS